MLVLARYPNQRILIGDDIIVEVLEVKGDRVKLGVTCDRKIQVDREEVREEKLARVKH